MYQGLQKSTTSIFCFIKKRLYHPITQVDTYPQTHTHTHTPTQTFSEVKEEGAIKLKVQLPISICRGIHDSQQLPKSMAAV